MGESLVEAWGDNNNKMGESVASHGALEVSISFGRFESDSLSWEKWSSFSPNKYLEEVEKCSTPGSVAQKKAYFEAHYKRIAARKAELLEQENAMGTDSSRSEESNCIEYIINTSGRDTEFRRFNGQSSVEEVEQDKSTLDAVSSSLVDEPVEDGGEALECESLIVEGAKEEQIENSQSNEVIYQEEAALVTEEILSKPLEGHHAEEPPPKVDTETIITQESKEKISELDAQKVSQKVTQIKKELNLSRKPKNKPLSPSTKTSGASTARIPLLSKPTSTFSPRVSRPLSTSTPTSKPVSTSITRVSKSTPVSTRRSSKPVSAPNEISVSRSSTTPHSVSSSRTSKNSASAQIKRATPRSLHMSPTQGRADSDSASLTSARKSSIMEQMGDKDIVKRAFKAFQNSLNQLRPTNEESRGPTQISVRGSEHKVSTSITSQKENERNKKTAEKMDAQRTRLGTQSHSTSSRRSLDETGTRKNVKVVSSSGGPRITERARRHKQVDEDAETKGLRQSLNFKAGSVPGLYRGSDLTKTSSAKQSVNSRIGHKAHG